MRTFWTNSVVTQRRRGQQCDQLHLRRFKSNQQRLMPILSGAIISWTTIAMHINNLLVGGSRAFDAAKKSCCYNEKEKNEGFKTKREIRGKRFQALQVYILLLDKWVRLDSNEICLSKVSTINTVNTVNTVNKVWSPLFEYETKSQGHSIEKVWSHLFEEEKIFTENKEKIWRSHWESMITSPCRG